MREQGFSLMELMIVMAIIGILVTLAIPSYQQYMRRAQYSEVVQAAKPLKLSVSLCYQMTHDLDQCVGGEHNIPKKTSYGSTRLISTTEVRSKGVIVITPQAKKGFSADDTYILTPSAANAHLTWHSSGGAVEAGYAN